jgi:hypothetical protein
MTVKWVKTGKQVSATLGTILTYRLEGTPYTVESRKRPIPHANRAGTWSFTSYFVLKDGADVAEKHTLRAAKEYAEALYNGGGEVKRDG